MIHETSVEGVIIPGQSLPNIQIVNTMNVLKIPHFRGVYCRNESPHKPNNNECGIINLDDSQATHWCCWFKSGCVEYSFDSYRLQPYNEIVQYLKSPIHYSTDRIQPDGTVICGHLRIYVLHRLLLWDDMKNILNNLY